MLPTLQAARTLFAAGEMVAATDMLAALDAAGAADAMALHLWGMTLSQLDRPEEAAVVLERAIAAAPSLSNAKADLAEICAKTGDDDRAITLLRSVNECVPGHTSGRKLAELLVAKALPLVEDARYAEALPLLQEAVQLNLTVPDALALLGMTLSRVGSPWQAEQVLREALWLYPGHFGSMTNLAGVLDILNRPQEAEALCRQVIGEHAPDLAAAWCNLGAALRSQGRIEEAQAIFEKALAMEPDLMPAMANLGTLHSIEGRVDASVTLYKRALNLPHGGPLVRFLYACDRLKAGDWETGWQLYEGRASQFPTTHPWPGLAGLPSWPGGDPHGLRILVETEQGLGDSLHFFRYAQLLADRGATVGLLTPPPLVRLFRLSAPGLSIIPAETPTDPADWDFGVPLLSLPHRFGTRIDTMPAAMPCVRPDPADVAAWKPRVDALPGLKVGLVWAGGARPQDPLATGIDQRRSMTLSALAPLASVKGVDFVSLQKGPPAVQGAEAPFLLHDWTEDIGDMADTAALASLLDLVIAVDTSVAHLAGGLDRPVLLLSRYDGCWRWLRDRDDTPWYPRMRLFRQRRWADWTAPVEEVTAALAALAENR